MARIAYDEGDARAFEATRQLAGDGLHAWRDAVARHLGPAPGMRLLDLGSGTGMWARAFTGWYGVDVVRVEPSAAMRARDPEPGALAGDARTIPVPRGGVDAAWLSTVVHHLPDLPAAARELRRVVRPGGPVLIRSAFAGGHDTITLFRFFPEAVAVLDTFPAVGEVAAAFAAAGFTDAAYELVPQVSAPSLRAAADNLRRAAHTPLQLIDDAAYDAGLARLRRAAATGTGPVVDHLGLLVLREQPAGMPGHRAQAARPGGRRGPAGHVRPVSRAAPRAAAPLSPPTG
jgi:SAM-dependent methyltransferase